HGGVMWLPDTQSLDPALDDEDAMEEAKATHRERIRERRLARRPGVLESTAIQIAGHATALLQELGLASPEHTVAAYAARPQEPGTGPLLDALHDHQIRVLLPM